MVTQGWYRRRDSRAFRRASWLLGACVVLAAGAAAHGQSKDQPKSVSGFGESRRGDVPSGTLEMMTTETDQAIQSGLAWLAR
ncbi:MAG: hypothetical protein ACLQVF_38600, partial [Isosphaeraceae bacterium]